MYLMTSGHELNCCVFISRECIMLYVLRHKALICIQCIIAVTAIADFAWASFCSFSLYICQKPRISCLASCAYFF